MTMTVMTENKLETNQQEEEEVESDFAKKWKVISRPFAVKNQQKSPKSAKIIQNHEKLSKAPKTSPTGLFEQFLSVLLAYKSKIGWKNYPSMSFATKNNLSPVEKWVPLPTLSPRISQNSLPFITHPLKSLTAPPPYFEL
jgi:hypothetical protein